MKIFDLHQDLMTHMRFRDSINQPHQTDFSSLEDSEIDLVVATAFPMPPNDNHYDTAIPHLITEELSLYHKHIAGNKNWKLVEKAADLDALQKKLILHIEGLNTFSDDEESWKLLNQWIAMGVRSIGTHWNISNTLGGGTLQPNQPLTELGRDVIAFLEDKNIIFDMAHMGRQSFYDAAKIISRPLYVSHGNADAVCSNVRNYTDDQLRLIAESGGVIGVFFANTFVTDTSRGTIKDVVRHIRHIGQLIGMEHIAIGTDFGGIVSGGIKNLSHTREINNLFIELLENGYSEGDIENICHKNAHRVLKSHLA